MIDVQVLQVGVKFLLFRQASMMEQNMQKGSRAEWNNLPLVENRGFLWWKCRMLSSDFKLRDWPWLLSGLFRKSNIFGISKIKTGILKNFKVQNGRVAFGTMILGVAPKGASEQAPQTAALVPQISGLATPMPRDYAPQNFAKVCIV